MKTVNFNGVTVTGEDNLVDDVLYRLEKHEVTVVKDALSFSDMLERTMQFNSRFLNGNLTVAEKVTWTIQYLSCISNEMEELRDELPWKHWKDYTNFTLDFKHLVGEMMDIQIFLMAIYNVWGVTGADVIAGIADKMGINEQRQETGY